MGLRRRVTFGDRVADGDDLVERGDRSEDAGAASCFRSDKKLKRVGERAEAGVVWRLGRNVASLVIDRRGHAPTVASSGMRTQRGPWEALERKPIISPDAASSLRGASRSLPISRPESTTSVAGA